MKTGDIAKFVEGEMRGDGSIEIFSCADLVTAQSGQIAFIDTAEIPANIGASCVIASNFSSAFGDIPVIVSSRPKLAFARIAAVIHPQKTKTPSTNSNAFVAPTATIGNDVFVDAFVTVGENSTVGNRTQIYAGARIGESVSIGESCVIYPNVVVGDNCSIGNNVVLHSGVVIGADGFGYVRDESGRQIKFPQIGNVVIEDNVEIGSNSCIDRAALGETRIGEGTKIDNLVQVGHNVKVGRRCVIAAQTGISGSVVIEDDCVIGGQVGFGDHVRVMSGAVIGSQAGILSGKIVRPGVWWGTPIQPLADIKRQHAHIKSLERLKSDVKELKKRLS